MEVAEGENGYGERSFDCTVSNGSLSNTCAETVRGRCSRRYWLGKAANVPLVHLFVLLILQERHGPLSDCPIQIAEKLVIEYMETTKDSGLRKSMERQYGKRNLERLVTKYEEDRANREWLEKSTMSCPSCHVHVEKSMGCNHMTCSKCKQHFCYRCGSKLQASNPYEHFSRPGTGCYSKLFDVGWEEPMEGFVWV